MDRGDVEGAAEAPNRAANVERVEAMLVKHERDWFSRNESVAGVWVEAGGLVGAHSTTQGGVEWAANMPIKSYSHSE